jgi:hypothetical protein
MELSDPSAGCLDRAIALKLKEPSKQLDAETMAVVDGVMKNSKGENSKLVSLPCLIRSYC